MCRLLNFNKQDVKIRRNVFSKIRLVALVFTAVFALVSCTTIELLPTACTCSFMALACITTAEISELDKKIKNEKL